MKLYRAKVHLHAHTWMDGQPRPEPEIIEHYYMTDDNDDIKNIIQMSHGCFDDVTILSTELIDEDRIHTCTTIINSKIKELLIDSYEEQIYKIQNEIKRLQKQ